MSAKSTILNPINFFHTGLTPDYSTYWPNPNNQTPRTKWVEGEKSVSWYKQFLINESILFQMTILSGSSNDIDVYKYNETTGSFDYDSSISGVDVTPSAYISETRLVYSYIPTENGLYYLNMSGQGMRSDYFIITSYEKYTRRLLPIEYTNSYNTFSTIFESDYAIEGTFVNVFTPVQYFDAKLIASAGTDISGFESDAGGFEKTRSTIVDKATLKLFEIHKSYIKHINRIFACDNITVAGIRYENEEAIKIEQISKTDLVNITVELREHTISNYYD